MTRPKPLLTVRDVLETAVGNVLYIPIVAAIEICGRIVDRRNTRYANETHEGDVP